MKSIQSLVDVTRALQLESHHLGTVVLARADGTLVGVVGDAHRVIFPRSAVKIIQAVPLIESGAAARFQMSDAELAMACASHNGAPYHVALASGVLQRIGLDCDALACGGHAPLGVREQQALWQSGGTVSALHNNCSGKHAGMLATAQYMREQASSDRGGSKQAGGVRVDDYEMAHHEVQVRIRRVMEEVTETDLGRAIPAIDGCSVPNWPISVERLAVAFARIVSGSGFAPARQATFEQLLGACWAAPEAMAGDGRLETELLRRFSGDVFLKCGAEGVCCGGSRAAGIGFAVKVDDGAGRAAEAAARAIIARLVAGAEDLAQPEILHNAAGLAVGDIRAGMALTSVLERIEIEASA